jgi:hypothetical protein
LEFVLLLLLFVPVVVNAAVGVGGIALLCVSLYQRHMQEQQQQQQEHQQITTSTTINNK